MAEKPSKPKTSKAKIEWVDPDDAPELTEEWFRKAHQYDGDKLIKRGEGPTIDELLAERAQRTLKKE